MQHPFEPSLLADQLLATHSQLASKITRAAFCQFGECGLGLAEVIRFLFLVAERTEGTLTPSHRVDLVWHEFILHTRAYHEFCSQHFGKFIHHQPGGDQKDHAARFQQTLDAYRRRFGNPPDAWWKDKESSCGSCESSL
jgi:hypothetical protein